MSTLLVELDHPTRAASGQEFRYAFTQDGESLHSQGMCAAALLPPASERVAIIPAQALSWHQITLPQMPAGKFRAALWGVLEEHVLAPQDHIHLTWSSSVKPGHAVDQAWVAVCDKTWLKEQLQALESSGVTVDRIVPMTSPRSGDEQSWTGVVSRSSGVWVISADLQGVIACPLAQYRALSRPSHDVVSCEPACAHQVEAELCAGPSTPRIEISDPGSLLLRSVNSPWDFAHAEFSRKASGRFLKMTVQALSEFLHARAWRWARWSAGLMLVTHLAGLNLWAWQEAREQARLKLAISEVLTLTFPHVKTVIDAPLQMEKELQLLRQKRGASTGTDFESMLSLVGGLAEVKPASTIEFSGSSLTLKDWRLSPEQVQQLQQLARNRRLSLHNIGNDWTLSAPGGTP